MSGNEGERDYGEKKEGVTLIRFRLIIAIIINIIMVIVITLIMVILSFFHCCYFILLLYYNNIAYHITLHYINLA